ncbi:hypothetical protein WJX74_009661 [Apatococcus lobatus]|uniref:Uncharacterized protein n=1 Tax=Apatococcus lobatus TaxID=904363 RepID=A0AAW1Q5T6_9CHLO
MWYHEYDEETCVSSFTKGPNLLFACSAVCRGSTRSAATMLELGAPTGTYHQGIARQFCHSEPPLTVVLGGVSPARVPHTDQWIPAAEGVVTSADETWMRCYGLADLVKYLTPRLYRLTPEEIEQAKAQSIQEMETRARKRQETAAARQQQQSTAQPDTVDQQQTVYREDVDFFGDLSHSTPSTPARRRAANYHRQS